ncbi:MAG: glycosyltransferase [Desulfovibrio sp.]|nr:glycosyltransferase [Desulfovibrio sp.]
MQNILWIGSPFFCRELHCHGWANVKTHNFEDVRVFNWQDLLALAGFTPDVLVVADKSRPPFVLGVENFPCLTVFYSVDSHIHSWQPRYAQAFDVCLFSLKDHRRRFVTQTLPEERVIWSPPFAREEDGPNETMPKEWDCLFVGTVDENTPRRALFLRELKKRLPGLHCTRGDYRVLYPGGRVILNYSEHGDLNFRVFEATGCGACLVTPRVGHGLSQLFTDGEHLLSYAADDVDDALSRIEFLLEHPEFMQRMGAAALEKVNAGHRARHRARAFADVLRDIRTGGMGDIIAARRARADFIRETYLKLVYLLWADDVNQAPLKEAYLAAARGKPEPAPTWHAR